MNTGERLNHRMCDAAIGHAKSVMFWRELAADRNEKYGIRCQHDATSAKIEDHIIKLADTLITRTVEDQVTKHFAVHR
jgi:hypothetical protein